MNTSLDINSTGDECISDTLIYFNFSQDQQDNLKEYFNHLNKKRGFNGNVLIGQKDSIFFEGTYGFANYKQRDSLQAESIFQLASVSKQFTAVAILQLYEQGLLDLNDSIQRFFPEFPYKGVTIHQLMVHRSGLPNYHYFMQHIPTTADTSISNQDLVREMIEKNPKTYYRPNQRYHYSNTGYALLAAIVEQVTQLKFEDYLEKYVFEPLGMTNSFAYRGDLKQANKPITTGYLKRWRLAEDNYLDGVLGDKGVYCSTHDLFKWDQGLYANLIINTDTLKTAFKPLGKPQHFKSNYGYGWRMFHWNDSTKVLFHAGWWHGYKSLLIRIPKDSTTIIVLKNRSSGVQVSTKSLLNMLYPKQAVDTTQTKTDSIATQLSLM